MLSLVAGYLVCFGFQGRLNTVHLSSILRLQSNGHHRSNCRQANAMMNIHSEKQVSY